MGLYYAAYRHAICVSGTHGKTTTTSMLTHIFMEAGRDPTVMIGGSLPLLGAGHRVGQGDTIILESCEYCNSFLNFFPTTAVVLDIDADHLDYFKDLADIEQSFRKFVSLVPEDGLIVANGDDKNTRDALEGISYTSFGIDSQNDVYGEHFSSDYRSFDVICGGKHYCHLELGVLGRHNAMNALLRARSRGDSIFRRRRPKRRWPSSAAQAADLSSRQLPWCGRLRRLLPPSGRAPCASERRASDGL